MGFFLFSKNWETKIAKFQKGAETVDREENFCFFLSFSTSCYVDHKTTGGLCAKESTEPIVSFVDILWDQQNFNRLRRI